MITNGYIQKKEITGGGLNNSGDPIPVTSGWSQPIEAHIIPNGGSLLRYNDGEMVVARFSIFIALQPFECNTIRIMWKDGTTTEEFRVIPPNVHKMELAGRLKITV